MKIRGRTLTLLSICLTTCSIVVPRAGMGDEAANPSTVHESAPRIKSAGVSAPDAIERLVEGNRRFYQGNPQHPHEGQKWRSSLESGQHPFAVLVGCSDARVPPELIFDQGFGDLFVVRVAGNVVDVDVTATVEYAVDHLDTRLVVVMGHTHCGAVTATLDHLHDPGGEAAEVVSLLYQIEPAFVGIAEGLQRQEVINQAVRQNVQIAVRRLSRVPDLRRRILAKQVQVVGAVYDMHTGKIQLLK